MTDATQTLCDHGHLPGECPEDQAQAMTDAELGQMLISGRWTTIEVHEAGRRLMQHG